MSIIPQSEVVHPGEKTQATIIVTNMDGALVPDAEIAFFIVNDKIFEISDYSLQSLIQTIYPARDAHPEWNQTLHEKLLLCKFCGFFDSCPLLGVYLRFLSNSI